MAKAPKEATEAPATTEAKKEQKPSQRVGHIKPGSFVEVPENGDKKAHVTALVVNAEGKEHPVRVYGEKRIERFKAIAEAGESRVFSGPLTGTKDNHYVLVNAIYEIGGPKNKAEKGAKAKVEKTPEEKAAAAKAAADKRVEANLTRFPVKVGSIAVGDNAKFGDRDVKITAFGKTEFEIDEKGLARFKSEFEEKGLGEIDLKVGDKVVYATFEVEEPSPAP